MYIHGDNKDIAQYTHCVFVIKISHAVCKKVQSYCIAHIFGIVSFILLSFPCQFTLFSSPLKYSAHVIYGWVLVSDKCSLLEKTSRITVQNKVVCIDGYKYLRKLCSVKCLYLIYFCIKQFMLHKRVLVLSMYSWDWRNFFSEKVPI
jgi:hypothetical protein